MKGTLSSLCLLLVLSGFVYGRRSMGASSGNRRRWGSTSAWTPDAFEDLFYVNQNKNDVAITPVTYGSSRHRSSSVRLSRPEPFLLELNERQEPTLVIHRNNNNNNKNTCQRWSPVRKMRDHVGTRISLASRMVRKGSGLVSRASYCAVTSATSLSLGAKLVSDCHDLLLWQHEDDDDVTSQQHRDRRRQRHGYVGTSVAVVRANTRKVVRQVASAYDRRRKCKRSSARDDDDDGITDGILTSDERATLISRTESLTKSVLHALSDESLWTEVNHQDGVTVWKTDVDVKNLLPHHRHHHPTSTTSTTQEDTDATTVKSEAMLNASPLHVYTLLNDDDRVHEYNDNCVELRDLEFLSTDSKINWSATSRFGPFSARDFVTLVSFKYLGPEDGYLSLAISVDHPTLAPVKEGYVRSQIQLAATFMRPVPGEPDRTKFVQVMQVGSLGGVADSPLAQRIKSNLELKAPVDFVKKFNHALGKRVT